MYIEGWAFRENADEISTERIKRFKEIKDLKIVSNVSPGYNHTKYYGNIGSNDLSHLDILLICDRGNTCFGGFVQMLDNGYFEATVYTD